MSRLIWFAYLFRGRSNSSSGEYSRFAFAVEEAVDVDLAEPVGFMVMVGSINGGS